MNRMVTKGYQKGVYEWVTKGIMGTVPLSDDVLAKKKGGEDGTENGDRHAKNKLITTKP